MRVYFVRHGQSVSNASAEAVSSIGDGDRLSEDGWDQARRLGKRLADHGLTHLVTSPMRRAKETAEAMNETLRLPMEEHPDIYEVRQADDFYKVRGPDRKPLSAAVWMAENEDPDHRLDGSESFNDVIKRVESLKDYLEKLPDRHIAVVSHGNFLRFFLGHSILREEFAPRHFLKLWNMKAANTGITIFDYEEPHVSADGYEIGGWRLATWMDHEHL